MENLTSNWNSGVLGGKIHTSHILEKLSYFEGFWKVQQNNALQCVDSRQKSKIIAIWYSEKNRNFWTHKWKFRIFTMGFILTWYTKICTWMRKFCRTRERNCCSFWRSERARRERLCRLFLVCFYGASYLLLLCSRLTSFFQTPKGSHFLPILVRDFHK